MSKQEEKKQRIAAAIKTVVSALMDRVMNRVLVEDPFIKEAHHASKPLYAALVPDEIFKGAHFERRFVTPFGGVWENLASVVALENHGHCLMGHNITGVIGEESLRRIQQVLNKLEHKGKEKIKPNWADELKYIKAGGGNSVPVTVTCDIFIDSKEDKKKYAFELKAPLPNSDQTKVSKEKMFKLLAMSPPQVNYAFFALPYNPYGKAKSSYSWGFPKRWFNMHQDESVLIGEEFWDLIGGDGTYDNFIYEINHLGKEYKDRIYREFLEIDPPHTDETSSLK